MTDQKIILIPGDGIGPEIIDATENMLQALALPFVYERHPMGQTALEKTGELLPKSTLEAIRASGVALKGPVTTPIGSGFRSVNVALRQHFDLFANIRPITGYGSVPRRYGDVNLVIFRENTEDLYAGIEETISPDEGRSIKIITRAATRAIAQEAFRYAEAQGKDKVTVVTKANIMKATDGLFLDETRKVAQDFPSITLEEKLVDAICMELVLDPTPFGILVTENLYGDILSDLCAGLVGGLGLAPGANMGKDVAVFEAVHGTAPQIAGQNKANPTALFLSAAMMLDHLGYRKEADAIRQTTHRILSDPANFTADLGGLTSTQDYTQRFIRQLKEVYYD